MTMMTCPKCAFEQPKDQFCAKCGVNVENYKPTVALSTGLKSLLKPVFFVIIILGVIFFLFKNIVDRKIIEESFPDVEIQKTTQQIGVSASSLNTGKLRTPPPPTKKAEAIIPPPAAEKSIATKPIAEEPPPETKFNQISATFTVAEHGGLDFFNENNAEKTWSLMPQISPINSFVTEEMTLKKGSNTFDFVDDHIRYDITLFIEDITDKNVKMRLNMRRLLRTKGQNGETYSTSINTAVPVNQNIIIVDALPRNAVIDRSNSILSTLYKSQSFLSHASELVQIIKFENPSNSPQEELTP